MKTQSRLLSRAEQSRAEQSRAEQSVRCLGNIYGKNRGTGFAGNVWDKNCISPTITTCQGGGREPSVIEVMKLNNSKKPIDVVGFIDNGTGQHQSNTVYGAEGVAPGVTTIHGGTQQIKILDAQALRMIRTEDGKALRKAYENHEIHHGFNEHKEAEPRTDCVSNTVTTVQKDNHIIETKQLGYIEKGTGKHQSNMCFDANGLCPCVCAGMGVKQQPTMTIETRKIEPEDFVMDDGNFNQRSKVHAEDGICRTIMGSGHAGNEPKVLTTQQIVAMRGRNPNNPSDRTSGSPTEQRLEVGPDNITNTLTTVQKDNLVLEIKKTLDPKFHNFLYEVEGEIYLVRIRKLIPKECGRLMGVDDESIEKMLSVNSNTQCYKQFGNSIVVPVLMGIFSQLGINGVRRWNDMSDAEIIQMIDDCK